MRRFAACLALVASAAWANDHRGSLGLTLSTGGEFVTAIAVAGAGDRGGRIPIELGATLALFDRTELRVAGRLEPGLPPLTILGGSLYAGIRNSFGFERWKTFFDLDFAAHLAPQLSLGGRVAVGLQYDVLPIMGVYATIGGQLGGFAGLRLSFEGMVGVQFRTYLFE
ncbi:MAG: hypothetical protein ACOZQL_37460 [Myxococcota bacterium]